VSKILAGELQSEAGAVKAMGVSATTEKTAIPGPGVVLAGGTPDKPEPVHGAKPSVVTAKKGHKVKKKKIE
jgi:hypothetical protein